MHEVCRGYGELSISQQSRPAFSLKLWTRLRLKWVTASRKAWKWVHILFILPFKSYSEHISIFLLHCDIQIVFLNPVNSIFTYVFRIKNQCSTPLSFHEHHPILGNWPFLLICPVGNVFFNCSCISIYWPCKYAKHHWQDCSTSCLGDPGLRNWPRDQPLWCIFAQSLQKNARVVPPIRQ